jgi:hypothetical protein
MNLDDAGNEADTSTKPVGLLVVVVARLSNCRARHDED